MNGASSSLSFGTASPARSQTPIAGRFTRPGFIFTFTNSTIESWRQSASSTSLDALTCEREEGREEEGAGQDWVGTRSLLTPEQGFHVAEGNFIQEIGGARQDIQPPDTPSPTTAVIQSPFDDTDYHEQSPVQPSKTLRNIKKSLRNCEYNAFFHGFFHCDIETTEYLIKAILI